MSSTWRVGGEVSEREELLDGRFQVVLDGEADGVAGLEVTCTLVWLLGREGEVALSEGYLTVVDAERGELNASLEAGAVSAMPETGAAAVRARFVVDGVDGELAVVGDRVACELEVGAEGWGGELVLGGD